MRNCPPCWRWHMGNTILHPFHSSFSSTLQPHLPRGGEASCPSCLEAEDSSPWDGIQIHTTAKGFGRCQVGPSCSTEAAEPEQLHPEQAKEIFPWTFQGWRRATRAISPPWRMFHPLPCKLLRVVVRISAGFGGFAQVLGFPVCSPSYSRSLTRTYSKGYTTIFPFFPSLLSNCHVSRDQIVFIRHQSLQNGPATPVLASQALTWNKRVYFPSPHLAVDMSVLSRGAAGQVLCGGCRGSQGAEMV